MHSRASVRRRAVTAAAVASAVVITGLTATQAHAADGPTTPIQKPGTLQLVSKAVGGSAPTGESRTPSVTPNGRYVVFQSIAKNLTSPADQRDAWDVFWRDTKTGVTKKVSTAIGGGESNGDSLTAAISANGRYVVFMSNSSDLVRNSESRLGYNLFVKDLKTGKTTRIFNGRTAETEYGSLYDPSISADGKVIAFHSNRADLVPNDTNGDSDIFVWRRATGKITRVSVTSSGQQAGQSGVYTPYVDSMDAQISADGKTVVFRSSADNLVKGDTNEISDIFLHNLRTRKTTRISVGPRGQQATGGMVDRHEGAGEPSISADGEVVTYSGFALKGLVKNDDSSARQVYVYNRATGKTRVVAPAVPSSSTGSPSISPDGRYVGFVSDRADLVPGDAGRDSDVFVKDLKTNRIARASASLNGQEPNSFSGTWGIDVADGGKVAFDSQASNLVKDKVSGSTYQVFLRTFGKSSWKR